jgi:hypothetical protein
MAEAVGGPAWDTLRSIQIDLRGLREFAEAMRSDVDGALKTQGTEITRRYSDGVPFGHRARASGNVVVAQDAYRSCLTDCVHGLLSYIDGAEVMVAAALQVAARYADADTLAKARADDVRADLVAAQTQVMTDRSPGSGRMAI